MILVESRKNEILNRRTGQDVLDGIRVGKPTERTRVRVHPKSGSSTPTVKHRDDIRVKDTRFEAFPNPTKEI